MFKYAVIQVTSSFGNFGLVVFFKTSSHKFAPECLVGGFSPAEKILLMEEIRLTTWDVF